MAMVQNEDVDVCVYNVIKKPKSNFYFIFNQLPLTPHKSILFCHQQPPCHIFVLIMHHISNVLYSECYKKFELEGYYNKGMHSCMSTVMYICTYVHINYVAYLQIQSCAPKL